MLIATAKTALLGILYCALLLPASAQPATSGVSAQTPKSSKTLDELIDALSSPDFRQREQATRILKSKEKSFTEELKHIYHSVQDHETRIRIREIAEALFFREPLAMKGGFLGIRMDARGSAEEPVVNVVLVVSDSAAARAGLRAGDQIIQLDGDGFAGQPAVTTYFADQIRARSPGEQVRLTIRRGGQIQDLTAVLGFRPLPQIPDARFDDGLNQARIEFEQWCSELHGAEP